MNTAFWIAWRELNGRKDRFWVSVALFAILVALCTTIELVSKSREVSLAEEIDQIGPAIQVIPRGLTQTDLTRLEMKGYVFETPIEGQILSRLSDFLRALDSRLILNETVDGQVTPVIGIDRLSGRDLKESDVVLGHVAAERLKKTVGDKIVLRGYQLSATGVLPSAGNSDDLGLFLNRGLLREVSRISGTMNEIRLYLFPGKDPRQVAGILQAEFPDLVVLINDRGVVADQDANESLRRHRFAVYMVLLAILFLSLVMGALLNARERIGEMLTLVGIGGTRAFAFYTLFWRSVIVTLLASTLGYGAGVLISFAQGVSLPFLVGESMSLFLIVMFTTFCAGSVAVVPAMLVLGKWRQE